MSRFVLIALLVILTVPGSASAGGFFLADRGTRASGRGNAFVAGADDPASLYYNPAGLADAGRQLLADVSLPRMNASYARIDGGGNPLPRVEASQAPLPIPTLAYSDDFGLRRVAFGAGVWAPNAAVLDWPERVVVDGQDQPAPQRYSLLSLKGTLITTLGLGVAVRISERFSVGVTGMLVTGSFGTRTTLSSCDGAICTQPENPDYDTVTQVTVPFFAAPTASFGVRYASRLLRVGASFDLPYTIRGDGHLSVRLPSAAIFENATIEGTGKLDPDTGLRRPTATLELAFPWILRTGVEVRPVDALRVEAAFVMEGWSRQEDLVLRAHDVWIRDVVAVGDYQVGTTRIPRGMRNTYSIRVGGELDLHPVVLRAGVSYERGAFPNAYLTALTLDANKVIASVGISVDVGERLSLDGAFVYSFMRDPSVRNSVVPQANPIRPQDPTPNVIGNGDYEMDAFILSVGLRYRFRPPTPVTPEPEAVPTGATAAL